MNLHRDDQPQLVGNSGHQLLHDPSSPDRHAQTQVLRTRERMCLTCAYDELTWSFLLQSAALAGRNQVRSPSPGEHLGCLGKASSAHWSYCELQHA